MARAAQDVFRRWQRVSRMALRRVEVIALFPILTLSAYASGGPELVLGAAMVLPTLMVLQTLGAAPHHHQPLDHAFYTESSAPPGPDTMRAMLERISSMPGMESACFMLEIDGWDRIERDVGIETGRDLHAECRRRLHVALRGDDLIADTGPAGFGIVLHPIAAARLSVRDAIADRLRAGLAAPIAIGETTLRLTACVGHAALSGQNPNGAEDTIAGASSALAEAQVAGPGSVRSYVRSRVPGPALETGATPKRRDVSELAGEVPQALETGAIQPWFQPQIDLRTGAVIGFEALARWQHPDLGLLRPGQFLDAVEAAGCVEELGTRMRQHALSALRSWDRAGHKSVTVSVNADEAELRSPSFAEHVAWDLDAAGVAPERMIVEVLESVAGDARDDAVMSTLAALRSQGVGLDLDDFGVGQASLMSIRRFGVHRIKIDRSFVIGIDADADQQSMVSGIVWLGRQMGLDILAEGIETQAEQTALTELGCKYGQGFVIAEPMAVADTLSWLTTHAKVEDAHANPGLQARPAQ